MFAVHKKRDIIPLDVNGDIVDSDDEIPVFDLKGFFPLLYQVVIVALKF